MALAWIRSLTRPMRSRMNRAASKKLAFYSVIGEHGLNLLPCAASQRFLRFADRPCERTALDEPPERCERRL